MTIQITLLASDPQSKPALVSLYTNFVKHFEKNLNQLSLVQFLVAASKSLSTAALAIVFLQPHLDRLRLDTRNSPACILLATECAGYTLANGDTESCLASIGECQVLIDSARSVNSAITAAFYRVSADYYKAKAAYPLYYHNALLYLSAVNIAELQANERVERAHDLAISALLGDGLYNFGELVINENFKTNRSSFTPFLTL